MRRLRPLNVSMGLMLESASPRLRERGRPHHRAPDKDPDACGCAMIAEAGRAAHPVHHRHLIGIGETLAERVESLAPSPICTGRTATSRK